MTDIEFQSEAERLMPRLKAAAQRYMSDATSADDVVQNVMMKLWELRDELRLPFDALALTLTRNMCVSALRHKHNTVALEGHDAEDVPSDDSRVELMMRLIGWLKPMQQLVIRLRHISGEEMSDIAEMIGMSEPAVRKCLSRGRIALRKLMLEEMKKL